MEIKEYTLSDRKNEVSNLKVLLYGKPFAGKTTFASTFPNALVLSTDGNYQSIDSMVIDLRDSIKVTLSDNSEKTIDSPWEIFKITVNKIVKNKSAYVEAGYKTIVIDNLDDLFEVGQAHTFEKNGWTDWPDINFQAARRDFHKEFTKIVLEIYALNSHFNIIGITFVDEEKIIIDEKVSHTARKPSIFRHIDTQKKSNNSEQKIVRKLGLLALLETDTKGTRRLIVENTQETDGGNRYFDKIREIINPTYEKIEKIMKGEDN